MSIDRVRHRSFRFFLAATVTLSVLPASFEEETLDPRLLLVLPAAIAGILRSDYRKAFFSSERFFTFLLILYIVSFTAWLKLTGRPIILPVFLVYFTFGTIISRALSPLTDRNLAQLIGLSVGMVLIDCIVSNHMVFGIMLPVYVFCLMGTLLLFHLARFEAGCDAEERHYSEEAPTARWKSGLARSAFTVSIIAAILFVVMPRPFAVIPGLRGAMTTSSPAEANPVMTYDDMTSVLGMAARARIAFAARFDETIPPEPVYWRGRVLEKTDGVRWYSEGIRWPAGRLVKPDSVEVLDYQILPYRLQSRVLYVCGTPVRVLGRNNQIIGITGMGEVIVRNPFHFNNSYYVAAALTPIPAVSKLDGKFLETGSVPEPVKRLTEEWTRGAATSRQAAQAIQRRLRTEFTYKLQPDRPPRDVNPAEFFLLGTRTGNCENFARAMALMLRTAGIPSRVVEGFSGMEPTSEPDLFVVRFARAHAWVEANLGEGYWTTFDPTPPAGLDIFQGRLVWLLDAYDAAQYEWISAVVNFDRSSRRELFAAVSGFLSGDASSASPTFSYTGKGLMAVIAAVVIGACIFLWVRKRRGRSADPSSIYLDTMNAMVRNGALRKVHPWHEENFHEIAETAPHASESLEKFMEAYLELRFRPEQAPSWDEFRRARSELVTKVNSVRPQTGT